MTPEQLDTCRQIIPTLARYHRLRGNPLCSVDELQGVGWLAAASHTPRFNGTGEYQGWIGKKIHLAMIDHLRTYGNRIRRSKKPRMNVELTPARTMHLVERPTIEDELEVEARLRLVRCDRRRDVLREIYLQGTTGAEIARREGISEARVSHLRTEGLDQARGHRRAA